MPKNASAQPKPQSTEKKKGALFDRVSAKISANYQLLPKKTKRLLSIAAPFYLLFVGYFAGIIAQGILVGQDFSRFKINFFICVGYGLLSPIGLLIVALVTIIIYALFHNTFEKYLRKNPAEEIDERGIAYTVKGTYGTARWLNKDDAKKVFEIAGIDNIRGTVLGQYDTAGREVVALPETGKIRRNQNILVIGPPGSGKTTCLIYTNIFQAARRGESLVITDPSNEIYDTTADFLRQHNYLVKVINLKDPQHSDCWDCMQEIFDPDTDEVSPDRLGDFVQIIMDNTSSGKDDTFWADGEKNLLTGLIAYLAYNTETALDLLYKNAANQFLPLLRTDSDLDGLATTKKEIAEMFTKKAGTRAERKQALRSLMLRAGATEHDADEVIRDCEDRAGTCTTSDLYLQLVNIAEITSDKVTKLPIGHPASIALNVYLNAPDNARLGFAQGLSIRLSVFQNSEIRRITNRRDIVCSELGKRPCAYFCIIPDNSSAKRALSSLFFSFVFKDNSDESDKTAGRGRIPINAYLDEFANIGKIPAFDTVMSTVRKRKIGVVVILQSIGQLVNAYGPDLSGSIVGCCDTQLVLACNDNDTAQMISDRSGVATIQVSMENETYKKVGLEPVFKDYGTRLGEGKRNILTPHEVMTMDENTIYVISRGHNILQLNKLHYSLHPDSRNGTLSSRPIAEYRTFETSVKTDAFERKGVRDTGKEQPKVKDPAYQLLAQELMSAPHQTVDTATRKDVPTPVPVMFIPDCDPEQEQDLNEAQAQSSKPSQEQKPASRQNVPAHQKETTHQHAGSSSNSVEAKAARRQTKFGPFNT